MSEPSTYRVSDGEAIEFAQAATTWAAAARPVLVELARRYGSLVTYKELSQELQETTGIRTKKLMHHWIGSVLGEVAHECASRKEPILTAFCVQADGTVGPGYLKAVIDVYGDEPIDLDMHAAIERLEAHKFFDAELPADGGRPTLPRQIARKRATAARAALADRPARAQCPTCWLELPATGQCDNCLSHL
ncbi:MAG: hypothetical protein ACT4OX_04255 [Actinomycetota bacterium]